MKEIIASPYFKYVAIPLITAFLSIFVKMVSRNDQFTTFKKEDFAVGLDILVTSLIIFIADSATVAADMIAAQPTSLATLQDKFVSIPWVLAAFVLALWGVSTLVRKLGWENEDELKIFWGIIVPDFFGVTSLIFVVTWIGR